MKSLAIILLMTTAALGETNRVQTFEETLNKGFIPSIEFREASPLDVIDFLISSIEAQDPEGPICTSLVLNLSNSYQKVEAPDPRKELVKNIPLLSFELHRVTPLEAIRQITAIAGLTYEITTNSVLIKTKDGTILNKTK
jgi:hypothetical protein